MDLEELLNKEQYEAVTHDKGPLLVIAGAGSGKTRVIEYRVLNLILAGVNPRAILLLTFTRRASKEMISRASRQDARCQDVDGGTFHSFAVNCLRRYSDVLGINKSFTILDGSDCDEALHKNATTLGYYEVKDRFPQKQTLRKVLSMATNKKLPISEVLELEYPNFIHCAEQLEKLREVYQAYKLSKSYFDYDDLLLYLRVLLQQDEPRKQLAKQYEYIMVDEYQDTNFLQGEIVRLLGKEKRNVMVVGDDAQSIYGFRGAHHENILKFPELFEGAKVIKLEANYRSTQEILDLGNLVLDDMAHKFQKTLTSAEAKHGDAPKLMYFKDTSEEAAYVVEEIMRLYHEGEPLNEMAVLFRSAYLSFQVQAELAKAKIPFQVFGGKKFSDTAHVKELFSFLKILANPKDELAWNKVLSLLAGVGPKTASKITNLILENPVLPNLLELLKKEEKKKYGPALFAICKALASADSLELSTTQKYQTVLDAYMPYLKDRYDNWTTRKKDLDSLHQIASRYQQLDTLLMDFAIEPPDRDQIGTEATNPEEGHVSLSTVHSSKGLEWKHLYVIGMIDGLFPTAYALRTPETLEEEERLFYVALTRAKDQLTLSMAHYGFAGGVTQVNKLSRFVDHPSFMDKIEIPKDIPDPSVEYYENGEDGWGDNDWTKPRPKKKPAMTQDELLSKVRNLWD